MTGLSEQQLAEIAARAGHLYEYVPQTDEADQLAGTDAPALLAEIARLRGALSEATGYVAELEADLGGWSARVAELEAERHSTNEALSKADEALRAKDQRITELETERPSRFAATPAEVDVYLRTILAEDAYLRYQQAIGDAVLDEVQTSGKTFRATQEAAHGKHVYLAGMDDVLSAIWDNRYYPAQLLCSKHNGFGPCKGAPWCTPKAGDLS